mmetsp:Transcript_25967/g.85394  ORF Transcript_25967/g.85394 Transcript_25967/m.85394 type:complete len:239 (-) Transcript_25967:429-1145(-)
MIILIWLGSGRCFCCCWFCCGWLAAEPVEKKVSEREGCCTHRALASFLRLRSLLLRDPLPNLDYSTLLPGEEDAFGARRECPHRGFVPQRPALFKAWEREEPDRAVVVGHEQHRLGVRVERAAERERAASRDSPRAAAPRLLVGRVREDAIDRAAHASPNLHESVHRARDDEGVVEHHAGDCRGVPRYGVHALPAAIQVPDADCSVDVRAVQQMTRRQHASDGSPVSLHLTTQRKLPR